MYESKNNQLASEHQSNCVLGKPGSTTSATTSGLAAGGTGSGGVSSAVVSSTTPGLLICVMSALTLHGMRSQPIAKVRGCGI